MSETIANLAWLVLFLPLAAAVGITLFTHRDRQLSAGLSIGAVIVAFIASTFLFSVFGTAAQPTELKITWLSVGGLQVQLGLHLDLLSLLMLLIVTGVGSAIHIYSYGYMHDDRGLARYFASLSFFTFSMLGIVLSTNFLEMFFFWELVGLSSYLLIGFWYDRPSAADASKKAFLTNRVGDFGFLLGILVLWSLLSSLDFGELQQKLTADPRALGDLTTVAGLLIFCGAVGKSAQFPLHVWLPDAMEGPTPVSALIHAATMVAAGVYMLCRTYFLFNLPGSHALMVVAWVGGFTALLAAVIAVQQDDIKRILAYSTLSQLGYMVMAVGVHGPTPAMYHLTTHAFFKALLFLGAGSVIHSLHHEQNIWKMGGLMSKMPVTAWTFLIGTVALAGVPPFSGFYSKDEILAAAFHQNLALFALGTLVAILTTFYMVRLFVVAFCGSARSAEAEHAHESPGVMTVPLLALAVPATLAGFWGIGRLLGRQFGIAESDVNVSWFDDVLAPFNHAPAAAFAGLGALLLGAVLAWPLYSGAGRDMLAESLGGLAGAMRQRFYFDEVYDRLIAWTQEALAAAMAAFDRWIIAGLVVRGLQGSTDFAGRALRLVQTGNLQTYAFLFAIGVALVLFFMRGR
jgi:NADH-quinone oxidoreductase subunit L